MTIMGWDIYSVRRSTFYNFGDDDHWLACIHIDREKGTAEYSVNPADLKSYTEMPEHLKEVEEMKKYVEVLVRMTN